MVQRFRFIGITTVSILLLTIVGAAFLSPAYAVVTMTLNISPNPALPGQTVTFSGQVSPPVGSGDSIIVAVSTGACPGGTPVTQFLATATNTNPASYTTTGTLSSGSYFAVAIDHSYAALIPAVAVHSPCVSFTVSSSSPIPEYPFGLAVLTIFMIIAYGVIRRKTATKQK